MGALSNVTRGVSRVHAALEHAQFVLSESEDALAPAAKRVADAKAAATKTKQAHTVAEAERVAAEKDSEAHRRHVHDLASQFVSATATERNASDAMAKASDVLV